MTLDLVLFAGGWLLGWMLLWRPRPLPAADGVHRPTLAVVIPARDEAAALPQLLPGLVGQLRSGDELVVVDDGSSDATVRVAESLGATVIAAGEVPAGWLGKPHACWRGASATSAAGLVFIDADVQTADDLLDRLGAALARKPDTVVSVQPWHRTGGLAEQGSVLANVAALMGCGAFTVLGRRVTPSVAFGPVLAVDRAAYDRTGGHAHPSVRGLHTEDIGLARAVGRSDLYTGRPDTTFRMYPGGLGDLVRGWTRTIATGARFTPWWLALATAGWMWSLAGGWLVEPLLYPLCALQVWVLGRRAASIHPVTAALYPLAVALFALIFVRSAVAVVFRRDVTWKRRSVAARPD